MEEWRREREERERAENGVRRDWRKNIGREKDDGISSCKKNDDAGRGDERVEISKSMSAVRENAFSGGLFWDPPPPGHLSSHPGRDD